MLTGVRMFEGETVTDTLAKILEREPEWDQLPSDTPPALRQLLQRCLTKNPKNRLQSIGDARIGIQELIDTPEQSAPAAVVVRVVTEKWLPSPLRCPEPRLSLASPSFCSGRDRSVAARRFAPTMTFHLTAVF